MANVMLSGCLGRTPPAGACEGAAVAANLLVSRSVDALMPFFEDGSGCGGLVGMVTHGRPSLDAVNVVAGWVETIALVGTQAPSGPGAVPGLPGQVNCSVALQLWLGGYPTATADGKAVYAPAAGLVHQASNSLLIIGENWYRGLAALTASSPGAWCEGWGIETMTALEPQGGAAGWELGVTLTLNP